MKKKIYLLIDATLFVVLMNFIEAVLMPGYWIKSVIKFLYIVLSVVVYCGLFKKRFDEAVYFNKAKLPWVFYAGLVGVYILFIISAANIVNFSDTTIIIVKGIMSFFSTIIQYSINLFSLNLLSLVTHPKVYRTTTMNPQKIILHTYLKNHNSSLSFSRK